MQLALKRMLNAIYPPQCAGCQELTDAPHGLCPECWRETSFLSGQLCDCCSMPVPVSAKGRRVVCDICLKQPLGWDKGRAAFLYEGTGRRVILSLKHGDRLDLARPIAKWMGRAGADLISSADIIAPVPLYWSRFFRRRFNQSAELARNLIPRADTRFFPDLIMRCKPTIPMEGMTREIRFATQKDAFLVPEKNRKNIQGANVLIVDDVMTTGATLSNCTEALHKAGAANVNVLVAARVAREKFSPI